MNTNLFTWRVLNLSDRLSKYQTAFSSYKFYTMRLVIGSLVFFSPNCHTRLHLWFLASCKSNKFQHARWSQEVAIFPEVITNPPNHIDLLTRFHLILLCIHWYWQILCDIVKYEPILLYIVTFCPIFSVVFKSS